SDFAPASLLRVFFHQPCLSFPTRRSSDLQARREAKGLFRACLVNGLLDENRARLAVQMLVTSKPRGYIGILAQFERLVKLDQERSEEHTSELQSHLNLVCRLTLETKKSRT